MYNFFKKDRILSNVLLLACTLMLLGHNLFDRKVLFIVFCTFLIASIKDPQSIVNGIRSNIALISVLLWCGLSATWSRWPLETVEETLIQTMMFLTCLLISTKLSLDKIYQVLFHSAIIIISINLLYIVVFFNSSLSSDGMNSLYNHKNNFGLIMALCSMFILNSGRCNRSKFILVLFIISIVLLFSSLSKTSIFLFFISIILGYCFSSSSFKINPNIYVTLSIISLTLATLFTFVVIYYRFDILDYFYYNINEDFLTGRGRLWITMILHAENYLITGFGFNSVWGKGEWSEVYDTELYLNSPLWVEVLAASDGGYIDIIISLGIIGFFLFLLYIADTLVKILMLNDTKSKFFMLSILIFSVLHNITETTFLLSTNVIWFLFLLITNLTITKNSR
ncbi:O-antigen ligase family protein [Vibrio cholerae]|uniref:O-antigen ligase family protein n=1 Tax=Vibrio cholerae TaxID=666 RepID=UPI0018F0ECC2|nr:O-antigen ligase family protein [Vibrio cholerae]EKF9572599.1 O-antigen ligase family protein [Vibrio cholerae]MBJ6910154.1 O-antigen ligase family protein [Vibrio cholerae]MBJ6953512.1 O-antigen ligase family protein [Vibrio cholerae]